MGGDDGFPRRPVYWSRGRNSSACGFLEAGFRTDYLGSVAHGRVWRRKL